MFSALYFHGWQGAGIDLLPYFLLLLSIIVGLRFDSRTSMVFLSAAIVVGLTVGRLTPVALIWISILGLSIWLPSKLPLKVYWRTLCYGIFLILAIVMSNHLLPGFNNHSIFRGKQFSIDSIPFTMFLNFDKTIIGLFIYLFFLKPNQSEDFGKKQLFISGKVLGMLLILILPTALLVQYVRIDIKFPELAWIWILNNLFFVCLAEEGFFRGFIQNGLSNILPKTKIWSMASIVLASILFGLAHYKGGIAYIALASISGLFYGYAFQRTKSLESSIFVHFGLNLVHFFLFSYPALI